MVTLNSNFSFHGSCGGPKMWPFSNLDQRPESWNWPLGFDFFDKKDLDFVTVEYC